MVASLNWTVKVTSDGVLMVNSSGHVRWFIHKGTAVVMSDTAMLIDDEQGLLTSLTTLIQRTNGKVDIKSVLYQIAQAPILIRALNTLTIVIQPSTPLHAAPELPDPVRAFLEADAFSTLNSPLRREAQD